MLLGDAVAFGAQKYGQRPRRVLIADELPKNASGKVLKRYLREQCSLAGSPP